MSKSIFSKIMAVVLFGFVTLLSHKAEAVGFPTLDVPAVFQGVQATLNQVQSKLSTVQQTLSLDKMKQVLGDKFAGLSKLKDLKKIKEKADELKQRVQKRKEKLDELKEKYEKMKSTAEGYIEQGKNKVEQVKATTEGYIEQGKNAVEQVKETTGGYIEQGKNAVEQVKETTGGYIEQGKNAVGVGGEVLDNKVNFETIQPTVQPLQNLNSTTPSAFKKVSDNHVTSSVFVRQYVPVSYAAGVSGFKTGTDDNGNFYFSDELANWCGINFDDNIDEDTFENCFNTICADLNDDEESHRTEAKKRYQKILAETFPNIFNKANAIKNKAGSSTVSEDMKDLTLKAGDSVRSQIAIEVENTGVDVDAAKDQLQLSIGQLELSILNDKFLSYCTDWKNAQATEMSWEPGGALGTDDNGNFYFSDELAGWCGIGAGQEITKKDMQLCICTICEDINAEEESVRQAHLNRYVKVRGETLAGTYVNLIRYKKEAASFEVDERVDQVKNDSSDSEQTQVSALAEIVAEGNRLLQYQNLVSDAYGAMTVVFDSIPLYCETGPNGWEKLSQKNGATSKERCQKFVGTIKDE